MKFLHNIRAKMGYNMLCRKAGKVSRNKTFNNLETAASIAFLFDADNQENCKVVKSLIDGFVAKGKESQGLGMVSQDAMMGQYENSDSMKFFSQEKLTFFCFPDNEAAVQPFINSEFDILINLCPVETLSVSYIMGLSKSRFKVSPQLSQNLFADFILRFNESSVLDAEKIFGKVREYLAVMGKQGK